MLKMSQKENRERLILVYLVTSNNEQEVPLKKAVHKDRANNQAHELLQEEETDKHIKILVG